MAQMEKMPQSLTLLVRSLGFQCHVALLCSRPLWLYEEAKPSEDSARRSDEGDFGSIVTPPQWTRPVYLGSLSFRVDVLQGGSLVPHEGGLPVACSTG